MAQSLQALRCCKGMDPHGGCLLLLLASGFTCRWQLTPDQSDVLLSVDYRGLLPDEAIILELAPNNVIRLKAPENGPGAVFQASVWVERSILISFVTTRTSTSKGNHIAMINLNTCTGRPRKL